MTYRKLAKMYGWTFEQIADMSPYQQLAALSEGKSDAGQLVFRTEAEYLAWLSKRNQG